MTEQFHNPNGYNSNYTVSVASPSGSAGTLADMKELLAAIPLSQPGIIKMRPGIWNLEAGEIVIPRSGVFFDARGCLIRAKGSGDVFRMYDPAYADSIFRGGGIRGFPIIDGSETTGDSSAFHAGDILQLEAFLQAQNFNNSAGSKGVWFDNNYSWTEQAHGRIYAQGNADNVVFDRSANVSGLATGSFDRTILDIFVDNEGVGNGVSVLNGAIYGNGRLGVYGNFGSGSVEHSVISIQGAAGGGNASVIMNSRLNVGVENGGGAGTPPVTVSFDGVNFTQILNCNGLLDFSMSSAFTSCYTNSGNFVFSGDVLGDPNLIPVENLTHGQFNQTITANGQTFITNYYGVSVGSPTAAYTGLIMSGGAFPYQKITIVNAGTGSLTFAAQATSGVAGGTAVTIAAGTAATFMFVQGLWYRIQ